jgi:hypothetical protein
MSNEQNTKASRSEGREASELSELLAAPCLLCGYNGSGYWQKETHDKQCPWHKIGGAAEREQKMQRMIPRALLKVYGC